ncbi:nuclear transport factor 2 family protein [Pseudoclavibacter chungangensis]|uniref:Nuclear transport factor 2 family protein n=1 Tax=Pseudoclavibacter chungangensis TaxID=587635 RepID=A0A7J5BNM0_9MICO|nr:nuclear transport factor 2 family protein [Pseudoclavibacter chungangensis]KAB1653829.1 nuclear transport factor 2 family protein [Pseudoclavibacter chungangensis]NYJ68161.1 ketosteroid isomerase-like protein [Pseudoclavibacter chungangensis]
MYHAIVRRRVRRIFDHINAGDAELMLDGLGDPFEYRFHGRHAIGGVRTSRAAVRAWWERVFRLLPGLRFTIRDIVVNGPPWHTTIAMRASVAGPLPDGSRYENTIFQFFVLRWGKVVSVETLEQLQPLERALRIVADSGVPEALAEPIEG